MDSGPAATPSGSPCVTVRARTAAPGREAQPVPSARVGAHDEADPEACAARLPEALSAVAARQRVSDVNRRLHGQP